MKRPWMPLYVADYLADTAHLTAAESGAYMHLLIFYWVNGSLPSDEKAIARISRLDSRAWDRSKHVIGALFKGGDWKHKRVESELSKVIERSNINSANAKRRHNGRKANAHTLTLTHINKNFDFGRKEGFSALPQSDEFQSWKAWAFEKKIALWRELVSREQSGRSFDFEAQWPPEKERYLNGTNRSRQA